MQLGDLGADVIKVERAGIGDESRGWGPPFDTRGVSAYFISCNRNKLSLAANLDDPADVRLVRALIGEADVVVDNFMPGALARRGLDAREILAECSSLVWCTITGFGPDSSRHGYDYVVQAESGWMSVTGIPDGDPMKAGVALADVLTGKETAIAILAALAAVRGGGRAERHVSVSLFHTAVSAMFNVAQNTLVTGAEARRWGNAHPNLVPYQLFHASDEPVVIAVGNETQYAAFAKVLGNDALADARFASNADRLAHRNEVVSLISAAIAGETAAVWLERFAAAGIPAGTVGTVRDAVQRVGASPETGIAPQFPGTVRRPPPLLDEHGPAIRKHGWAAFAQL